MVKVLFAFAFLLARIEGRWIILNALYEQNAAKAGKIPNEEGKRPGN